MTRTSTLRGVVAPTGTTAPFLQYAEQLYLGGGRQLADLIQEQRAPVCRREVSRPRPIGTGECALLVAEQLGLHQFGRQRTAIDSDEGALAARARLMDGTCHQFLSGSCLALQ